MAHYKAGTVTLVAGSPLVDGVGCNWMQPNVYPGDILWSVDECPYEIAEVVSSTRLRLARGYLGPSATDQPYFVQPTQAHEGDLALKAAGLIEDIAVATETIGSGVFDGAGGVALVKARTSIGATPGDITYELGAGGQPALIPPHLQIADMSGRNVTVTHVKWNGAAKALALQYGVNRGTGVPGPGYGLKSLAGHRLFLLGIYGGKDSDGTTSAFCHAGYLTWTAEADNNGGNELDAMLHLKPGVATDIGYIGRGNGLQINCKMQSAFPGRNRYAFDPGEDYGAVVRVGAGDTTQSAIRFDLGLGLLTTPVAGAMEVGPTGKLFVTTQRTIGGVATAVRGEVPTLNPATCTIAVKPAAGATATASLTAQGPNAGLLTCRLQADAQANGLPILSVTYPVPFTTASFATVSPASLASAGLKYFVSSYDTGFEIILADVAGLIPNTQARFNFTYSGI